MKVLSAAFDVGYAEYMGMVTYTDPDAVFDDSTLGRAQQRRHGLHHLYRSPKVHLERTPVFGHRCRFDHPFVRRVPRIVDQKV